MKITVDAQLHESGFLVLLQSKSFPVIYPKEVWQACPLPIRKSLANFCAFFSSLPLSFNKANKIKYLFPAPQLTPLFLYGLLLSLPENLLDFNSKLKTSDYIRIVFNSFFKFSFSRQAEKNPTQLVNYTPHKNTALIPFTFGKDSLLTVALCQDLQIKALPLYLIENHKVFENQHRYYLRQKFEQEFGIKIDFFEVPLQQFKQHRGYWWGWDIFLTQYLFFLIPFLHYYKPEYFFWSNEQDRNIFTLDREGFILNSSFDQSARWLQILNSSLGVFGCNTKLGSLLEPVTELAVHYILHHRYPSYGYYQTSCNNELPSSRYKRWCAGCITCAEDYVMLLATGVDPRTVGFKDDMLRTNKRNLFYLFKNNGKQTEYGYHQFPFYFEQQSYSFLLAYQQGIRGKLMDLFQKKYLLLTQKHQTKFKHKFLRLYEDLTIPQELRVKVRNIFDRELSFYKKTVS